MALGPIWPAYFQRVFGCCGSRALPTCFLKVPGVLPLLWTATLLVLRTVPRPSCSVVFAAAVLHDSSQVNHGLLAEGPENAESSLLVDARIADADGALFEGVTSTPHGGGAQPQVGNLRRVLSRVHDTSDEGRSASEHSVDVRGVGTDAHSGVPDRPDGGSNDEESRGFGSDDFSTQEGFSETEQPVAGDSLLALEPAEDYEGEADKRPAPEQTMDYGEPLPEDGLPPGEEAVKGSDEDAGEWSHPDAGGRAAEGEEDRWKPDRSRRTQRGGRARERSFRSKTLSREAAVETEEQETDRSRKASGTTLLRSGRGTRKRRCWLSLNAMGVTALLATLGVALLGGGAFAVSSRRKKAAAPPPKK